MIFCSNCGNEISSEQKYCCHCATANPNFALGPDMTTNQNNAIFNRDVLKNYLNNLQTLEFAKHKLNKEKTNLEHRISYLGRPNHIRRANNIFFYLKHLFWFIVMALLAWILYSYSIIATLVTGITAAVIAIIAIVDSIKDTASYIRKTRKESNRIKEETKKKTELSKIVPSVRHDLSETEQLLKEAYSINIIPSKYRNLGGVNFLYEYISTSVASLSEALYHCDLDEISRKLDVIIDQQQEMILELARSNALNAQIVRQNEEMLKHAIETEKNTALAAQYSQIAAINSKTMAQIQSYYYYKNGL